MRRLLALVLVLSASVWARPDFVMRPEEQGVIHPRSTFNAEAARLLLEPGDCTLRGVASDRQKSGFLEKKKPQNIPPAGSKIYLFPYTAYCEEVVKLCKEYTPAQQEHSMETLMAEARLKAVTGKGLPEILPVKRVEVDPEFSKIWKAARTDAQGRFAFENLRPGRYYLQSVTFMVARGYTYNEQVGEEVEEIYWSNGEVSTNVQPIWTSKSSTMMRRVELVKVVDITRAGETVNIELNEDWDDFRAP